TLKPGSDVYVLRFTPLPTRELSGPVVLFTGTPDSANPLAGADVKGAWAAIIATAMPQGIQINPEWVMAVLRAGAIGWMVISNRPDAQWQNRLDRTTAPTRTLEGVTSDTELAAGALEFRVAKGADSICNGADDDASGTTAVLEAAEAFARLAPHPRRSLAFMTVSGEERGLWGSQFFSEHPTVPLANVVADLNSDMVGRNWKDTIVAIGK